MEADIVPLPRRQEWTTRLSIKLFRYKGLIKRYWWLLLTVVSLSLAIEGWMLYRTPVRYASVGLLMVTEPMNLPDSAAYREESEGFFGNQLTLLADPEIHDRARDRVALDAPELPACPVEIKPELEPRTSLFTVTGMGSNGPYTQRFVQALMEEFIKFKDEKLNGVTGLAESKYGSELTRLGNERDQRDAAFQAFVQSNNMGDWEEQGRTAAQYLATLKTRQADRQAELERLERMSSEQLLSQPQTGADPKGPGTTAEYSEQYLLMSQQLAQKKAELAERSLNWKPAHPRLIEMKDDIARMEAALATIAQQNSDAAKVRIGAIKTELDVLDKSIAQWNAKALAASQKDAEYQHLKEAVNQTNTSYDNVMRMMEQTDLGKGTPGAVQIEKIASYPEKMDPGTAKHLLTGLLLGLAVGIAILAVIDKADDRFSSSTEVMEHFTEPILGQIPDVNNSRTKQGLPLLTEEDDRYSFAESFRSLRSSLLFMPNQGQIKSLLVTSSIPGEGKSTIASNLAITMSLAGTRVLLIDADLRRGDLASLFDLDGRFGLSTILRDEMPWRNVVKNTVFPGLSLIPRGPVTNQSSELLLVPRLTTMMKEWKSLFDLVLFNTSPILATDDTSSIAPNFDGALMVMRSQFTSARLVRNSLNAMYQRQVNVLGLILNCVNTDMPDYYYYRYPKYYAA